MEREVGASVCLHTRRSFQPPAFEVRLTVPLQDTQGEMFCKVKVKVTGQFLLAAGVQFLRTPAGAHTVVSGSWILRGKEHVEAWQEPRRLRAQS